MRCQNASLYERKTYSSIQVRFISGMQNLSENKYGGLNSNRPIVFDKPVSERSTQMGMALGKGLFSWAVGKALERSGLGFLAIFI